MFEAEARDQDFRPAPTGDQLAKGLADDSLGAGEAALFGVRRVPEQEIDTAVPELGEHPDVGAEPVDGRVVELPVAGVEDPPGRSLDADAHGIRNRQ